MNRKIFAVLLAAAMAIASPMALAEGLTAMPVSDMTMSTPAMSPASITVQGTAQVLSDPDEVTVTANTSVTAGTVGSAQEEMNRIVEAATTKLLELGVQDDDIVTSDYSYYPRYNYETNTLTGYEANHTLSITCRDVEMLDSVIGALSDSGFSQIYSVSYDVSTRSELYQQALELAIQRAEQKALRMAATSGLTLTGLRSITENGGYNEGYAVNGTADMGVMKSEAASATGIRAGSVSVSASVTVVYDAAK
ncbi:MAG: SIMPL domain-containing protein [Candidatus Ventricola sp.]